MTYLSLKNNSTNNKWLTCIGTLIAFLVLSVCWVGCTSNQKPFHRETEIKEYLIDLHDYEVANKQLVNIFLLYPNYCGSCYKEGEELLIKWIKKYPQEENVLLLSKEYKLPNNLYKNVSQVFIDKQNLMERYGLMLASGIFIRFENNKILYWNYISEETIPIITKVYLQFENTTKENY